jgi:hypothetical protein
LRSERTLRGTGECWSDKLSFERLASQALRTRMKQRVWHATELYRDDNYARGGRRWQEEDMMQSLYE